MVSNCWRYREQGEDGRSLSRKRAGQRRWRGKRLLACIIGRMVLLFTETGNQGRRGHALGGEDHELGWWLSKVTWDLPVQTFIKQLGHETESWREAWRASQVSARLWCGVA